MITSETKRAGLVNAVRIATHARGMTVRHLSNSIIKDVSLLYSATGKELANAPPPIDVALASRRQKALREVNKFSRERLIDATNWLRVLTEFRTFVHNVNMRGEAAEVGGVSLPYFDYCVLQHGIKGVQMFVSFTMDSAGRQIKPLGLITYGTPFEACPVQGRVVREIHVLLSDPAKGPHMAGSSQLLVKHALADMFQRKSGGLYAVRTVVINNGNEGVREKSNLWTKHLFFKPVPRGRRNGAAWYSIVVSDNTILDLIESTPRIDACPLLPGAPSCN